ncbi:L,D-transpeptidase family protein [Novosphingobium sp. SL115]|uniref:L,D-transpeptidase family protein n=1 Tax=Novosphingobium sp. SL115 TaxID=2995150 RepID=UPI002274A88C|nr:L,D-transpeptidase family protein [Novosphingobium sp. SL115]MCY1669990.1 L,D-transpeptidase family protein [Novosphingobium sp. SL115]
MTGKTNFWNNRWVRLPLGFTATALASLLAFHAGQDIAEVAFGNGTAEAAPAIVAAPKPAIAQPALTAKPVDSPFVVKSILPINEPIKFGKFYWDEARAPASGPLVVTVDLTARVISVFRDGHEIGAAAILKGYGDKPTPTGIFPITQKDADHVSNIYDAPMPYMMRLTNDGVSIHGSKVEKGYATNGCVGVPDEFAAKLFKVAGLGDKVIITDGKKMTVGDPILAGEHAS